MTSALKVLIADNNTLAAAGITLELRSLPGVRPLGVAADEDELAQRVAGERPEVVILDPRRLTADPAALVRRLGRLAPAMRIVVLTAYVSDREHAHLRAAGASAVLLKEIDRCSIARALFE